jgi:hypothetical protein
MILLATASLGLARTTKEFFQNSDLTDGNNYLPSGVPGASNDVIFTTPAIMLELNGTQLSMGSVNVTSNQAYLVSNNTPGTANSSLVLDGGDGINNVAPNPADVIYVGGATSTLTFQRLNGDDGIGTLSLDAGDGNFDVAEAGATLNISASLSIGFPTKIGEGTMNIAGPFGGLSAGLIVNEGTVNFLQGSSAGGRVILAVNNPNTGAGTDVTVNLYTSETFNGLRGTLASPATGINTATVNLIGTGTELYLQFGGGAGDASFAGVIAGTGSVRFDSPTGNQTFSGNNTYSGTTTVVNETLFIDGTTSGQGNYIVGTGGGFTSLGGSGTIGLAGNGTVTVTHFTSSIVPGPPHSGIGTLSVITGSAGGVIFGQDSTLSIDVGELGESDRLAISGGVIDLTGTTDTLTLNALAGAFDGSDYTIATFAQNRNNGFFNTVENLPSGYSVAYGPTSIKLLADQLPLQLTAAGSRKMHGSFGPFNVDLLAANPVECRSSGGEHTFVFTFSNMIMSGSASLTSGVGSISGSPSISGKTITVNLTGVADAQSIAVTLQDVTDRFGQVLPDTTVTVGMLVGDSTGNGTVTSSDISQTKGQVGTSASNSNFREDVTVNGFISASDVSLVKSRSGAFIPQKSKGIGFRRQ